MNTEGSNHQQTHVERNFKGSSSGEKKKGYISPKLCSLNLGKERKNTRERKSKSKIRSMLLFLNDIR